MRDLLFAVGVAVAISLAPARGAAKPTTVGVVRDGPNPRLDFFVEALRGEVRDLLDGRSVAAVGDIGEIPPFSVARITRQLDAMLADRAVDVVLALGPVAASLAARKDRLPKPVLAPLILDATFQRLPISEGRSGLRNFNFLQTPTTLESGIVGYQRILERPKIQILLDPQVLAAAPSPAEGEEILRERARALGLDARVSRVEATAAATLQTVPPEIEGVIVSPLPSFSNRDLRALFAGLNARGIRSFSAYGKVYVEAGATAGFDQSLNARRLARQTALHLTRILAGVRPEALPISLPSRSVELVINIGTARNVGFQPRWELLTASRVVGDAVDEARNVITLRGAMTRAVESNLALAVAQNEVEVGEVDVQRTLSPLLPQIVGELSGRVIDDDRAQIGFGANPESAGFMSVRLQQALLREPLWANRSIQQRLQTGREAARREVELDVAQAAALVYLDVLRTQAELDVARRNLQLTRSNLELARLRKRVGVASPAEVPRWENQLAVDQRGLVQAVAVVQRTQVLLNQVMNRPLNEPFLPAALDLEEEPVRGFGRLFELLDRPLAVEALTRFMVAEGLRNAPEIQQLNASISAQDRFVTSRRRVLWLPEFGAVASLDYRFAEGGAGVGGADPDTLPPILEGLIPIPPDELNWQVGAFLSYPLFLGLGRYYDIDRAEQELARLESARREIAQAVEARVRTALFQAGATYPSIALSRRAAAAAEETLRITSEAYAQGTVPLLRLLDAQTAFFAADTEAARAEFIFLGDFVGVQRAAGDLDVLLTQPAYEAWLDAFEKEVLSEGRN